MKLIKHYNVHYTIKKNINTKNFFNQIFYKYNFHKDKLYMFL